MSGMLDMNDLKERMEKAIAALKHEFAGLRTGRASANLLDSVVVNAYGQDMPINQVGTVNVPEPRMLSVQVWDKGMVSAVEKAIRDAGLGVNPIADGQNVRVPLPSLTEERRKELAKMAGKAAEGAKVAVGLGADIIDINKQSEQVQKLTDEQIKVIDEMLAHKEEEIMQV